MKTKYPTPSLEGLRGWLNYKDCRAMKTEDINKFVSDLYKDKVNLVQNLSDLFTKIGVVVMADTNAEEFKYTAVGESPRFPYGVQCKYVCKHLKNKA